MAEEITEVLGNKTSVISSAMLPLFSYFWDTIYMYVGLFEISSNIVRCSVSFAVESATKLI